MAGLIDAISLAFRTEEGPVTGRDGLVVLPHCHGYWTGENVEGEPLNPLVPVAFIELGTICWVSEQSRSLANLRTQGLVEGSETSGTELVPDSQIPVVYVLAGQFTEDGSLDSHGTLDSGDRAQLFTSSDLVFCWRIAIESSTSTVASSSTKSVVAS